MAVQTSESRPSAADLEARKGRPTNIPRQEVKDKRRRTLSFRRAGVSAEPVILDTTYIPKVVKKSEDAKKRIQRALEKSYIFKGCDRKQLNTVIQAVEEETHKAGDIIIKQGDSGDTFYFIEAGSCDVFIKKSEAAAEPMLRVHSYSAGDSFGELALLYNAPRAATVQASTDCILWAMDRGTFRQILMTSTSQKRNLYEEFLASVPLLKVGGALMSMPPMSMPPSVLWAGEEEFVHKISTDLSINTWTWIFPCAQQHVNGCEECLGKGNNRLWIPMNDRPLRMFWNRSITTVDNPSLWRIPMEINFTFWKRRIGIVWKATWRLVFQGTAEAKAKGKVLMKYGRGDYFGELALLNNEPRAASVVATSKCKVVFIDRESFKRLLGKLEDILQRKKLEYATVAAAVTS